MYLHLNAFLFPTRERLPELHELCVVFLLLSQCDYAEEDRREALKNEILESSVKTIDPT